MAMKAVLFTENGGSQNADEARLLIRGLLGGVATTGVLDAAHLKVSQRAAGVNLSVDVAPGHMFIEGQRSTVQGTYHVYNDAVINVPLSAADPTNPRIDVIYVRLRDSGYDGAFAGQDDSPVLVAQGTAAGSPAAPTPSGTDFVVLARVAVAAADTTIVNGDITDMRTIAYSSLKPWAVAWGELDHDELSADSSSASTTFIDSGLSVTWDAIAGRRYRITAEVTVIGSTSSQLVELAITNAANTTQRSIVFGGAGGVYWYPEVLTCELDAGATGALTYKLRHRANNTGTCIIRGAYSVPPTLVHSNMRVEDIGPA